MSTTVSYKGGTLTTVNNNTKILETAGTYLEDDITLVDVTSGGGLVYQDAEGFVVLDDGAVEGEIKYLYSDIDGEGAWTGLGDYKAVSYDFAPVRDHKFRYWIELQSNDLTFKAPVSVATNYSYRHTGMIDWGDGTEQTEYSYGNTDHTHTYEKAGRYCVSIWWTGGADVFSLNAPQSSDISKVIAIEFYFIGYPTNTLGSASTFSNVKKIRYSSSQTKINIGYCESLTDIILPESTTIVDGCRRCYALEKLTIPASVTTISSYAFANNTAMKEYHFLPTTPPTLNAYVFTDIPSDCKIYVPAASLSAYQTATNWSDYASYMVGE